MPCTMFYLVMWVVRFGPTAGPSGATPVPVTGVQPCKAEPKISCAKRRKMRDRQVAVRHATLRTQHLKSTLGFISWRGDGPRSSVVGSASWRAEAMAFEPRSVEQRIDAIETLISD